MPAGVCHSSRTLGPRVPCRRLAAPPAGHAPTGWHPTCQPALSQLGRASPADIVISIPTVSTRHAMLRVADPDSPAPGGVQVRSLCRRARPRVVWQRGIRTRPRGMWQRGMRARPSGVWQSAAFAGGRLPVHCAWGEPSPCEA